MVEQKDIGTLFSGALADKTLMLFNLFVGYSFLLSIAYLSGFWSFYGWGFVDFYTMSDILKSAILPTVISFVVIVFYATFVYALPRITFLYSKRKYSDDLARMSFILYSFYWVIDGSWIGQSTIPTVILVALVMVVVGFGFRSRVKFTISIYLFTILLLPILYSYNLGKKQLEDIFNKVSYRYIDFVDSDFDVPERLFPLKYITMVDQRAYFVGDDNKTFVVLHIDGKKLILNEGKNETEKK